MSNIVNIIFVLAAIIALSSATAIGKPDDTDYNLDHLKDASPMNGVIFRSKREDIIKFLVDAVDSDIDRCGSPLQIQNSQVTISVQSLTCIVQALVDSLNAGPGLLRKLLDNILKKRDLSALEPKSTLTRAEKECAMKAIIKEAIDVVRKEHGASRRHRRRAHGNDRCAQIENKIEQAMKNQMQKKNQN